VVCTRAVVVIHRVRWLDIQTKRCVTLGFKFQLLSGEKRFCICIDVRGLREHTGDDAGSMWRTEGPCYAPVLSLKG